MNRKNRSKISDGISFVMPAFNCEKTIAESIYSIINGNFELKDEIIIVNDGSNDRTLKVVTNLQKKYPFINVVNNPSNKGCPASRNIGIKKAKNKLIFNLDSDDILEPGSVEKLKKYLISNNADIAAFGESHFFIKNIKNVTHKWVCKNGLFTLADFLASSVKPGGNFIYTKSSWRRIGGYWEYGKGLHEFWGFELKQIASGSKFVVMPNSYYYHRYGHKSLFIQEQKNKFQSSLMATKMIKPFFHLLHPEDVVYIKSDHGSKHWLENLTNNPIRLENGKIGEAGRIEYAKLTTGNFFLETIKKMILRYKIRQKIETILVRLILILVGKIRYQEFYEKLYKIAICGMNVGEGANIYISGELSTVRYIKKKIFHDRNIIIFDVGANIGNYSQIILSEFKNTKFQLFCFEPSKAAFKELKRRLKDYLNIKLYNIAFGEKNTTKTLFYDKKKSGLASLYNRRLFHLDIKMNLKESIELKTVDNFCEENKIKKIDFLKLDVEGNELNVLKGAKKMIRNDTVRFIQFEFGGCNIDSRTYFQDFWYLLSPKYRIFRILKDDMVEISQYKEINEIFVTTNYLAILR